MIIRGVAHVHSKYSYDADVSLLELKESLKDEGLSFVCMTEHTNQLTAEDAEAFVKECKQYSDRDFVFIPGFEVAYKKAHVLMIGSEKFIDQYADEVSLPRWKQKDVFCVLAHPHRNSFIIDMTLESLVDAVEIWNSHYDGKAVPRTKAINFLKKLQKKSRPKLWAFSGLDLHGREHIGGPEIVLDVHKNTKKDILHCLHSGAYVIERKNRKISPEGTFLSGGRFYKICSVFFVSIIYLSKRFHKFLADFGIPLPKRLKKFIRSRV